MRITAPGDLDLDVRPGTTAGELARATGHASLWCMGLRLDADHPAGTAPLVHGARVAAEREHPPCVASVPGMPLVRVTAGPSAGGSALLTPAGMTIGRGAHCDLVIDDPAVSSSHAFVTGGTRPRVRDIGSLNGTPGRSRFSRLRRGRRLVAGASFAVGRSTLALDMDAPADARAGSAAHVASRPALHWGAVGAALVAGVMIAALTGRWYLALVALAAPLGMGVATVVARRRRSEPADTSWTPPVGPIAVRGELPWVWGYVRAVCIARERAPTSPQWREPWMRWLEAGEPEDVFVHVPRGQGPPSWCSAFVEVGPHARVEHGASGAAPAPPLAISATVAEAAARLIAARSSGETLPDEVRWADLASGTDLDVAAGGAGGLSPDTTGGRRAGSPRVLTVALGEGARGTVEIDLDHDGPHLLVAGTTGSGKSVALELVVSALAAALPPTDLTVALVDFKGGAGLRACEALPHVNGTLTDLDGALAARVVDALTDELAQRKRLLAERGHVSLQDWERAGGAPPRLLVVIDEYQEIVGRHPAFLPDLARLAAQGRSLGLHLVLATQRPAGAVTPEVRANVSTTLALRVASATESRDLVGSDAAAGIAAATPGRAILARGGDLVEVQVAAPLAQPGPRVRRAGSALAGDASSLAALACERWRGVARARPLWVAPLPPRWTASAGPRISVALADAPRERRQGPVTWDPGIGAALIVGPPRSGRSGALAAIARQAGAEGLTPVLLPHDPREAARTLHVAQARQDVLVIVDDAEAALARLALVDDGAAADQLLARLAMRRPTALAAALHAPSRLGQGTGLLAVIPGVDAHAAQAWGVPRDVRGAHRGPGRAWLRADAEWTEAQLAWEATAPMQALVQPLKPPPPGVWGVVGDRAEPHAAPQGSVTVLGAPGEARERLLQTMPDATVTCADAVHMVLPGTGAVVVIEPTPRILRSLAPRDWQGIAEPVPVPGRMALVESGVARALRVAV
ncbi:FtsK/SpoIIIE domain-containing protein [Demequina sp. NBRC 110053]|uniref:FtsK/SpoIIIE domain-containing protein n=1 Tax=Demequina sp. NBRC 110053 TaxID=1570342 RepID=UPI0009FF03E6|nr:FtsK/SpoIIIE domain-containing protein [Demequina sp. NBRC 110053]